MTNPIDVLDIIKAYCLDEIEVAHLGDLELKEIILNADTIRKFLDECEGKILDNLRNGHEYTYIEPSYHKSRDSLTPEGEKEIVRLLGEKAYTKKLITAKQAEEILGSERISDFVIRGEKKLNKFKIK